MEEFRNPAETNLYRKLEQARHDLLDLTGRNRLLSTERRAKRSSRLEIVDERSEEVFRRLVVESRKLSFLPVVEPPKPKAGDAVAKRPPAAETTAEEPVDDDAADEPVEHAVQLAQPEEDEPDEPELPTRHTDKRLQTELTSEELQRKLLKLFYDARTFEEEQGVNILYLALGFLKWQEADEPKRDRFAPLLLIPVTLERRSAGSKFRLRYAGEDISTNLSLQAKLQVDFGIALPEVPDGSDSGGTEPDELSPAAYFEDVRNAVAEQPSWEVLPDDIVLWFFSFSKFLMYRDLQPDTWPADRPIDARPLVGAVLDGGFDAAGELFSDDVHVDDILQPVDMLHVMDADSSQSLAIEEVKRDRNLVIQGPPGTGKSQTITNLIATAVHGGKKVLFVAEKMAALEVVKRRLDQIGLGDLCLELHSHKSNKRAVLDELSETLQLGPPSVDDVAAHAAELKAKRDRLNAHARRMHTPLEPAGRSPFQIVGELVRLRAAGVQATEETLVDPLSWTGEAVASKRALLEDLRLHLSAIGSPEEHPWRGVRVESMLPGDIDRLTSALPGMVARWEQVIAKRRELADLLEVGSAESAHDLKRLVRFAGEIVDAPPCDSAAIANDVWSVRRADIDRLLELGRVLRTSRETLDRVVAEVAWTTDVSAVRLELAAKGDSLLRFVSPAYWKARGLLRGILNGRPPGPSAECVALLDELIRGQRAAEKLENAAWDELGRRAFGQSWNGKDSDWSALNTIAEWESECRAQELPEHFRHVAGKGLDRQALAESAAAATADLQPILDETKVLFEKLRLDLPLAFSVTETEAIPLEKLVQRLNAWGEQAETLAQWIGYYHRRQRLEPEGLAEIGTGIDRGNVAPGELLDRFELAYHEALMREVFRQHPELAEFDGASHEQVLERFRALDVERIGLARQEVAAAHYERLPKGGGSVGELGIVRHEIQKKRRIKPIRRLLAEAGNAVQAIKPVFMMSPISIAQFLEPGGLDFDLLVIDEASQVRPVDALGALARCARAVVVGDDKQLPPTSFFNRMAGDDGQSGADFRAGDVESILGLCVAQGMPERMLRWHYRSRHHSLIAVSNREFYDTRLYVVPNPEMECGELGLTFRHIPEGVFDRGGSATNPQEARAVADAVFEHVRRFPSKTLGVGTFSVRQRDAILDEIELRRREQPEWESFFATGTAEPFFVKNLENIQGDERDVIFISVGYGRDADGFVSMNFGPLSNDGGERRLNVLISRARERCEVFSSMTDNDIDLGRAKSRGAKSLKTFLRYARTGNFDYGDRGERSFGSELERQVAAAVAGLGYDVAPRVGTAGFSVDLAVVDPEVPGRYLLGIECDGPGYESARFARDRDRIRPSVLESRGWNIHRIWSIDWFHRPGEQLREVATAIERARHAGNNSPPAAPALPRSAEIERSDPSDAENDPATNSTAIPYREASFALDTARDVPEWPTDELADIVARIVDVESPVHADEVGSRIVGLWKLKRKGRRIGQAIDDAIRRAVERGQVASTDGFLSSPQQSETVVRSRADVNSPGLRKPEMVPPAEIRAAVLNVVRTHFGASIEETVTATARMLGFRTTSQSLREVIEGQVGELLASATLSERSAMLYVDASSLERDQHSGPE